MRIGINLLYLYPRAVGGTETYARGLIDGLTKLNGKDEYFLFCNKECAPTFNEGKHVRVVRLPVSAINRVRRSLFEIVILPFYLRRLKIDVVHSLGYTSPVISPCPTLVNIYDLNWYFYPENFSWFRLLGWRFFVTVSAKLCTGIITSSYCSKKHLSRILRIPAKKIFVVYGGVPTLARPFPRKRLEKFGIKSKYVFTLTSDIRHKNIIGFLRAASILKRVSKNYLFVIAGLSGERKQAATEYVNNHHLVDNVIILGWVEPRDLSTLYKYASVFVIPSLHEGFGFPVLEAFTSGVPLASSNAFSLKEVVGNADLLFNPKRPAEMAEKINRLMNNRALARTLVRLGRVRVTDFSWEKSAKATLEIYNSVLKSV